MHTIEKEWKRIIEYLRLEFKIGNVSFVAWIEPLQIQKIVDQTVFLKVKSNAWAVYLKMRYKVPLQVSIKEVTGEVVEIVFVTGEETVPCSQYNRSKEFGLNSKYTFDTFVVGNNNKCAQAASLAVAELPGEVLNPLFIYGNVGLGKTHLLVSIANYIAENSLCSKVVYTTGEMFANELIETLRRSEEDFSMNKFREKYREADILLIDDIQLIMGKENMQEEFFHILIISICRENKL